jgi:fatty-acyl-CoA synthase
MRVGDLFEQSQSAIVLPDGTVTTAREIAAQGRSLALRLHADGLTAGDRIAVRLPNGAAYMRLLVAVAAARLVLVSVNTRYSDNEAHDLIERSGARRVFDAFDTDFADVADTADTADTSFTEDRLPDSSHPDDPFLVFTTSGTTSKPKMVRHTQRSIATHGFDAARGFGYRPDDVALLVMPFCGTFGMSSLTAALAANSKIVVVDQFDVTNVTALIREHEVSVVNGSDDMFHRLIEHGADLSSIRLGGYARFNTSLDGIVERAERSGATLAGLYGMSEVQALFSLRDPSLPFDQREKAGGTLVAPSADLRVVDNELYVRGPGLFEGYLCEGGNEIDDDLTASYFEDGWFRTGDSATIDDNRTFTYHSRIADVLRLGGFLVSPADIESVLLEVVGIDEAQVVTVDLPIGTRPVAFAISPNGFDHAAAITHCQARLARYKVPVRIIAIEAFPTTPSANGSKIQRTKLRDMAEASLADQLGPKR